MKCVEEIFPKAFVVFCEAFLLVMHFEMPGEHDGQRCRVVSHPGRVHVFT